MAALELDESGNLLVNGEPHQVPSEEQMARSVALMPQFHAALQQLSILIGGVDHEEWRLEASSALVRLLSAVHEEVFSECCPVCRATVEAVFSAGASEVVS